MRKWIILGVVLALVVGGVAIAIVNLNSYLNANKDWLRAEVAKALGREVAFDEVGVSLFPSIGASVANLRIAEDPAYGDGDFVRAGNVQVAVKVIPLISGNVEVSKIVLESPTVSVVRDAKGFNFSSLGKGTAPADVPPPVATPAAEETGEEAPTAQQTAAFVVALLRIQDGEVQYVDKTPEAAADLKIRDLDFEASDVSLTSPIEFAIAAALFGAESQNFSLDGELGPLGESVDVEAAPIEAKLSFDPLDVEKLRAALPVAAKQIPPGLGLSGPVKLAAGLSGTVAKLSVHDLDLSAAVFGAKSPNLSVKGSVGPVGAGIPTSEITIDAAVSLAPVVLDEVKKLEALAGAIPPELSSPDAVDLALTAKGKPDDLGFDLRFAGEDAAIRYGSVFTKPKGVPFALDLAARRRGATVDVSKLDFRLAELALDGKGTVATGEKTTLDFRLASNEAPLSGWDRLLPALAGHEVTGTAKIDLTAKGAVGGGALPGLTGTVALANVSAKQSGSPYEISGLTSTVRFDGQSMKLPPTKFQLGGSPVEVEATIANFQTPIADYRLESPRLRLASLALAGEGVAQEEVVEGLSAKGRLDMTGASPLFRGTVRSSAGTLRDIAYQDFATEFGLREEVATVDSLALRAYGGRYEGSGRYDMRDEGNPSFSFRSDVRDMELAGLLGAKMPAAANRIGGKLFADLDLTGSGAGWETIQQTLRGQGRMSVADGVIKDVNLAESVLGGITGVAGLSNFLSPRLRQKYPEIFATGDTKFDKLGASVEIADARATTNDLEITAKDYSIKGEGVFELRNELDFRAAFFASKALTADIVDDVKEMRYLAAADGRIEIPFRVTGALPDVKTRPDGEFIQKAIGRAVVEKGVEKLLGDKLDKIIPRAPAPPPGGAPGDEPAAQPTLRPEQELLKKGLEGLFGR